MTHASPQNQLRQMILWESRGHGDQANALERIAERFRFNHGTLDNLRTGRVSDIPSKLRDRLQLAYVGMLEKQLKRWEHELFVERQRMGGAIDADLQNITREMEGLSKAVKRIRSRIGGK